jgi:two-component system OmpR family response regulator
LTPPAVPQESSTRIVALFVEDDDRLARFTAAFLEESGITVRRVRDGNTALQDARAQAFDIAILDLMLPGKSGLNVCRDFRAVSDVPIIMVTARSAEADRIVGLELGADDYLVKPFSPGELVARVRALVRRARGQAGPSSGALRVGPLELHLGSLTASYADVPIDLTTYEFRILRVLAERRGRVLSREQILELAKGSSEEAFDRSVDARISRIRQKLGEDSRGASIIRTIRGAGYMLASEAEE